MDEPSILTMTKFPPSSSRVLFELFNTKTTHTIEITTHFIICSIILSAPRMWNPKFLQLVVHVHIGTARIRLASSPIQWQSYRLQATGYSRRTLICFNCLLLPRLALFRSRTRKSSTARFLQEKAAYYATFLICSL
ncbi:hypothetical protein Droror1_Dr00013744 [Drosera rotundifolia]